MLGHFLQSIKLRSAARKYASRLGRRLRHDYGAGEHYTASQIRAAAERCRLPLHHISIGYAAFMPREAFGKAVGSDGDYQSLRDLFRRYAPTNPMGRFEPAAENFDAWAGYPSSHEG